MSQKKFENFYYEAKRLYVKENKTLKEIKEITSVSPRTLSEWKNKEKQSWDEQRKDYLVKGLGGLKKLEDIIYQKIEDLDETASKDDIKILKELKSLLKSLRNEIDLYQSTILVMEKYIDFIKERHPDIKDEAVEIIAEFLNWIEEKK